MYYKNYETIPFAIRKTKFSFKSFVQLFQKLVEFEAKPQCLNKIILKIYKNYEIIPFIKDKVLCFFLSRKK